VPIPDYQTLMLPFLRLLADGNEHLLSTLTATLADEFKLTDEERREMLPSGNQTYIVNRVGWARTYLKKAGLVENTGRGRCRITDRGRELLKKKPARVDVKLLSTFPEFVAFRMTRREASLPQATAMAGESQEPTETPEELLETSYAELREDLSHDLLEKIKECSPQFFERLVVDLLVAMGYGGTRKDAGQAVGQSGDEGIDGIIKEDKLGLDVVYIQAKRWQASVGRPVVQAFAGSLEGQRARKGILITTSAFSKEAHDYVGKIEKKIILIDGELLAQLMIDHGVGVAEVRSYVLKKVDLDYFAEE